MSNNQIKLLELIKDRIFTGIAFAEMAKHYSDPEMVAELNACRQNALDDLNQALDEVGKALDSYKDN